MICVGRDKDCMHKQVGFMHMVLEGTPSLVNAPRERNNAEYLSAVAVHANHVRPGSGA